MNDIASICQRHVITIAADATLQDAALRMREREASLRGQIAAPARPVLRVPAMGTAGWAMP
jgi:hypothetical protein